MFQHHHAGPPDRSGSAPKKGYYPDPADASLERWWDGRQWTGLTRTPKGAREPLWRSQKVLLAVLAAALVAVVVAIVPFVRSGASTLAAPAYESPTTIEQHLDPGRYTLFQETGGVIGGSGFTYRTTEWPTLGPADVTVVGPDGRRLVLEQRMATETIERSGSSYLGVVSFAVERPGRYAVQVAGEPDRVILARSLFDGTSRWLPLLGAGAVVGGIAATTFLVLVIVKARRRRPV